MQFIYIFEIFYRAARDSMTEHLEKLFGSSDMPAERPILEVKIPDALPEAFENVLYYIYTDRIDCKLLMEKSIQFAYLMIAYVSNCSLGAN